MDIGGFASCDVCTEYLWIPGDSQGLCVECHERVSAARPDPPPVEPSEPQRPAATHQKPKQHQKPGRAAEHVRKKVERKYEKGKLGAKPKRAALEGLARALWDELPPMGQDRLADDLRALGFHPTEPFEAMVDFCEVTVLKRRNALKKEKKAAAKPTR
ncbi:MULTISPECIES: hypothetical protein [unclassified Mycobacterium]|uniref:hypothetical protein n=1 Tax=unclassified Mycobacterium TaxID=2642494 RepID=UPI0029C6C577|nr:MULTISPECIES: hypothetical protein [unclassified Mycobacterium]